MEYLYTTYHRELQKVHINPSQKSLIDEAIEKVISLAKERDWKPSIEMDLDPPYFMLN